MSWKQMASVLIVVTIIVGIQSVMAGPIYEIQSSLFALGPLESEHFQKTQISGIFDSWFEMGLVAVFVVFGVAIARVVRKELSRQARKP